MLCLWFKFSDSSCQLLQHCTTYTIHGKILANKLKSLHMPNTFLARKILTNSSRFAKFANFFLAKIFPCTIHLLTHRLPENRVIANWYQPNPILSTISSTVYTSVTPASHDSTGTSSFSINKEINISRLWSQNSQKPMGWLSLAIIAN